MLLSSKRTHKNNREREREREGGPRLRKFSFQKRTLARAMGLAGSQDGTEEVIDPSACPHRPRTH